MIKDNNTNNLLTILLRKIILYTRVLYWFLTNILLVREVYV